MQTLSLANVLLFVALALSSSLYENPEQDPLPHGPEAAAELERRWDFEVHPQRFCLSSRQSV